MDRIALVIGIDKYGAGISPLSCASNDAVSVCKALLDQGFDSVYLMIFPCADTTEKIANEIKEFDEKRCRIHNAQIKPSDITEALGNLMTPYNNLNQENKEHLFVFYFSGHGCVIGDDYCLLASNASKEVIEYHVGTIPLDLIRHITDEYNSQRLFIVDCCRNHLHAARGADGNYVCDNSRDPSMARISEVVRSPQIIPPVILSSCSMGQKAYEDHKSMHGYFTLAFLQAIGDNAVSSFKSFRNRLSTKLSEVLRGTSHKQTPVFSGKDDAELYLSESWRTAQENAQKALKEIDDLLQPYGKDIPGGINEGYKLAQTHFNNKDYVQTLAELQGVRENIENASKENHDQAEELNKKIAEIKWRISAYSLEIPAETQQLDIQGKNAFDDKKYIQAAASWEQVLQDLNSFFDKEQKAAQTEAEKLKKDTSEQLQKVTDYGFKPSETYKDLAKSAEKALQDQKFFESSKQWAAAKEQLGNETKSFFDANKQKAETLYAEIEKKLKNIPNASLEMQDLLTSAKKDLTDGKYCKAENALKELENRIDQDQYEQQERILKKCLAFLNEQNLKCPDAFKSYNLACQKAGKYQDFAAALGLLQKAGSVIQHYFTTQYPLNFSALDEIIERNCGYEQQDEYRKLRNISIFGSDILETAKKAVEKYNKLKEFANQSAKNRLAELDSELNKWEQTRGDFPDEVHQLLFALNAARGKNDFVEALVLAEKILQELSKAGNQAEADPKEEADRKAKEEADRKAAKERAEEVWNAVKKLADQWKLPADCRKLFEEAETVFKQGKYSEAETKWISCKGELNKLLNSADKNDADSAWDQWKALNRELESMNVLIPFRLSEQIGDAERCYENCNFKEAAKLFKDVVAEGKKKLSEAEQRKEIDDIRPRLSQFEKNLEENNLKPSPKYFALKQNAAIAESSHDYSTALDYYKAALKESVNPVPLPDAPSPGERCFFYIITLWPLVVFPVFFLLILGKEEPSKRWALLIGGLLMGAFYTAIGRSLIALCIWLGGFFFKSKRKLRKVIYSLIAVISILIVIALTAICIYNHIDKKSSKTISAPSSITASQERNKKLKDDGIKYYNEKNFAEAIKLLEQADQEDPIVLFMLTLSYNSLKRYHGISGIYSKLIKMNNESIYTFVDNIVVYKNKSGKLPISAENYNDAETLFKRLINDNSDIRKSHGYACLGALYEAKGDWENALNNYKMAKKTGHYPYFIRKSIPEVQKKLQTQKKEKNKNSGIQYYQRKEYRNAIDKLQNANLNDKDVLFYLGRSFYELKQYTKAAELYQKAAEKGHTWAMHNLALLYHNGYYGRSSDGKPNYEAAAELYQKAIQKGDADSMYNLALLYKNGYYGRSSDGKPNYEKAEECFRQAIKFNAKALGYAGLGLVYEEKKDFSKAVDNYQKALKEKDCPAWPKKHLEKLLKKIHSGQNVSKSAEQARKAQKSQSAVSQPQTGKSNVYTMKLGDSLPKIARRFGISAKELQKANNLTDEDVVRMTIGQKLIIPLKAKSIPAQAEGREDYEKLFKKYDTAYRCGGIIYKEFAQNLRDLRDKKGCPEDLKNKINEILREMK